MLTEVYEPLVFSASQENGLYQAAQRLWEPRAGDKVESEYTDDPLYKLVEEFSSLTLGPGRGRSTLAVTGNFTGIDLVVKGKGRDLRISKVRQPVTVLPFKGEAGASEV